MSVFGEFMGGGVCMCGECTYVVSMCGECAW